MEYLRFGVLGLATGSLYAMVALAIVLTYRASGVLNFTAGAVGAGGAYVFFELRDHRHIHWLIALGAALATGVLLGVITQFVVMRLLRRASTLVKLIGTLGVMTLVQGGISIIWGPEDRGQPRSILPAKAADRIHLFGIDSIILTKDRLIIIVLALVLAFALRVVYSKTLFGLATSAVAENRRVAALGGWSTTPIEVANFAIAGLLSVVAAVLLCPIVGQSPSTLTLMVVPALAAALVGGFSSFSLTVVGAMLIGVLQSEVQRFVSIQQLSGLSEAVPLVVIIGVTVVRGRARLGRGAASMRLPRPGSGRVAKGWLVAAAVCGGVVAMRSSGAWADAISSTLAMGILILSVVAVTGYGGQLSLCQYAFAGFGVWVAARLIAVQHMPFEFAVVAGVVATVLLGLVVALPALRTRGISLAVATLGLALMIQALIFNNPSLTGGFFGTVVTDQTVFGWNIDAIKHPQRYGLIVLIAFVLCGLVVTNVRRGRSGLRLLAMRSNERAAASVGVGIYGAKLYSFGLGAALAAVAGIFIGFRTNSVLFQRFEVFGSITALQVAVIGGIGWAGGALIGGLLAAGGVLSKLVDSFFSINQWLLVIGGANVLLVLIVAPEGQAAKIAHDMRRLTRARVRPAPIEDSPVRRREPAGIELRGVTVRFGGVTALDNVSFDVRAGEVLGLIGPNGAGKTTLLDVVSGFTRPASGTVRLNGDGIDRWSPERRARAGLIRSFQAVELFDDLTVRENLLVAADPKHWTRYVTDLVRPGQPQATAAMNAVVADFALEGLLDELPESLSHGAARLVGIARAVAAEPAVLFLDEPAAGLDSGERVELGRVIRRVAEQSGIAVVVVEHDIPLVTAISDRIVVLDFGLVIKIGTPAEVQADPAVVAAYLGGEDPAAVAAPGEVSRVS